MPIRQGSTETCQVSGWKRAFGYKIGNNLVTQNYVVYTFPKSQAWVFIRGRWRKHGYETEISNHFGSHPASLGVCSASRLGSTSGTDRASDR
jgi:hypothetical protein